MGRRRGLCSGATGGDQSAVRYLVAAITDLQVHGAIGGASAFPLSGHEPDHNQTRTRPETDQTRSEPDRNRIGTGSEPDRTQIGSGSEADRNMDRTWIGTGSEADRERIGSGSEYMDRTWIGTGSEADRKGIGLWIGHGSEQDRKQIGSGSEVDRNISEPDRKWIGNMLWFSIIMLYNAYARGRSSR